MDLPALLGRNFLRRRRELQLTQLDLSERSGLSQQFFSDLENGKCNVTLETLNTLAETVECHAYELLALDPFNARSVIL
jgi:transcriptional regulator with XRE-family HTH domain